MRDDRAELLKRGQAELASGAWQAAAQTFDTIIESGEDADARFGLGRAAWWRGDIAAALREWERAYVAYRRRGSYELAGFAAVYVVLGSAMSLGSRSMAQGWIERADRLVRDHDTGALGPWVQLCRAHLAIDVGHPTQGESYARQALDDARAGGGVDLDLELCLISEIGMALVDQGRVAEGTALLDEAMAGALAGEGRDPDAIVLICCRSITASSRGGDIARAMEWIRVAEAFHADRGSPHLYTTCRVEYGAVLFASGDWERAEEELERARGVSRLAEPVLYAQATGRLVELRLAQGRLDDAHRLLVGLEDEPAVAGTIAMLALARGEARASAAVASRRLHDIDDATLEAAALHEIVAEADVASGLVADALATGEHLTAQGAGIGNQLIIARGHRTCGRALLSIGDPGATGHLERAISIFGRLGLPYDASVSRLLLARATVGTDPEVAIAEARTAHGVFVGLGATREGDAAAALLRSLGVRTSRGGPRALGTLTHREREVLALLGEGLSNPEIGDRLFITRKTVEHHVASVLAKLGLSGRAEAAAYAVRHGTDGPAENG